MAASATVPHAGAVVHALCRARSRFFWSGPQGGLLLHPSRRRAPSSGQVQKWIGTMVTAERAKFRPRHKMEMGRSDGHTERHTTAHTESTHGEKTEKTIVRGEVEGLRTGPKMGEHVGAEITVHDPARHCGPALQLQHRNLYVAKSLGLADARCKAHGCNDTEDQTHLSSDVERYKRVSGSR